MPRYPMPPAGLLTLLAGMAALSPLPHDSLLGPGGTAPRRSPGECPGCGHRISENKAMCLKCATAAEEGQERAEAQAGIDHQVWKDMRREPKNG
jgi:hypothetical protein